MEVCSVFQINQDEGFASLQKLGKLFVKHEVSNWSNDKYKKEDVKYIFPSNPVGYHLIEGFPLIERLLLDNPEVANPGDEGFVDGGECPPSATYCIGPILLAKTGFTSWDAHYNTNAINMSKTISKVHELQNLYHEVSGEKLIFNSLETKDSHQ